MNYYNINHIVCQYINVNNGVSFLKALTCRKVKSDAPFNARRKTEKLYQRRRTYNEFMLVSYYEKYNWG